jgi:hypothetical protein
MGIYLELAKQAEARYKAKLREVASEVSSYGLPPCGSPDCGGCYDVGDGCQIHPPRLGRQWLEWRAKWDRG